MDVKPILLRDHGKLIVFYPHCGCWCGCRFKSTLDNRLLDRGGRASVCRDCFDHADWSGKERRKLRLETAPTPALKRYAERRPAEKQRVRRVALRARILEHYGKVCVCCRETCDMLLTIDHILNDGAEDRRQNGKGYRFYESVIRRGFPDTFQVLCFNCNTGRFFNKGRCPHEELDRFIPIC